MSTTASLTQQQVWVDDSDLIINPILAESTPTPTPPPTTTSHLSYQPSYQSTTAYDFSKPITLLTIQKDYIDTNKLINPLTFCLCGCPCSCVLMDYIRRDEWMLLHIHLTYYGTQHSQFLQLTTFQLTLSELIATVDKLTCIPTLNNLSTPVNNFNKLKPVGKRLSASSNLQTNHLFTNHYTYSDTTNIGIGNLSDSSLYKSSNTNRSLSQPNQPLQQFCPPTPQSKLGSILDDDDYDAFDGKYEDDDNLTRDYDTYSKVVNFSTLQSNYIPPLSSHLPKSLSEISYNHHPLSIGSAIYQYDFDLIQLHHQILLNPPSTNLNSSQLSTTLLTPNPSTLSRQQSQSQPSLSRRSSTLVTFCLLLGRCKYYQLFVQLGKSALE
jgi:hypothetical protein